MLDGVAVAQLWFEACRAGIGRIVGPGWLKSPQGALSSVFVAVGSAVWQG